MSNELNNPLNPLLAGDQPVSRLEALESYVGGILGVTLGAGLIINLSGIATGQIKTSMAISPWLSIPLLAACAVFDGWFIATIWKCLSLRELPLGRALALRQSWLPPALRSLQATWWLVHAFACIVFAIFIHRWCVRAPNKAALNEPAVLIPLAIIVFANTFTANLFLMLAASSFTRNVAILDCLWRWRFALDALLTVAVIIARPGWK